LTFLVYQICALPGND